MTATDFWLSEKPRYLRCFDPSLGSYIRQGWTSEDMPADDPRYILGLVRNDVKEHDLPSRSISVAVLYNGAYTYVRYDPFLCTLSTYGTIRVFGTLSFFGDAVRDVLQSFIPKRDLNVYIAHVRSDILVCKRIRNL